MVDAYEGLRQRNVSGSERKVSGSELPSSVPTSPANSDENGHDDDWLQVNADDIQQDEYNQQPPTRPPRPFGKKKDEGGPPPYPGIASSSSQQPTRPPPPAERASSTASSSSGGGDDAASCESKGFISDVIRTLQLPPQPEKPPTEEAFSPQTLAKNVSRFIDALAPFADMIDQIEAIMHWEQPLVTGALFVFYVLCVVYDWMVQGAVLVPVGILVRGYLIQKGIIPAPTNKKDDQTTAQQQQQQQQQQQAQTEQARPTNKFASFISGITKKVTTVTGHGKTLQNRLNLYSDRLEKIILILDWSSPQNSKLVLMVLLGCFVVTIFVPWWLLSAFLKINFGLKFFVTGYIHHRNPKIMRKYDSTLNFWVGLPTRKQIPQAPRPTPPQQSQPQAQQQQQPLQRPYSVSPVASSSSDNQRVKTPYAIPPAAAAAQVKAKDATEDSPPPQQQPPQQQQQSSSGSPYPSSTGTTQPYTVPKQRQQQQSKPQQPATAPQDPITAAGLVKEEVVGSWPAIYHKADSISKSSTGKVVVTPSKIAFVRGTGDNNSGTFTIPVADLKKIHTGSDGMGKFMALHMDVPDSTYRFTIMTGRDAAGMKIAEMAGLVFIH